MNVGEVQTFGAPKAAKSLAVRDITLQLVHC